MKYLIIAFLVLNSAILAQIMEIKGRVISTEDHQPLHLANIIIEGMPTGASSKSDGTFSLKVDLSITKLLIVSYVGFETKNINLAEKNLDSVIIIRLDKKVLSSQTILVKGSIGQEGITPTTFAKIKRKEIEESYTIQDIPEYLSFLPSTTFYSENGNGIGYNYISIRGFDQRRISISVNGIPQNDPEDHNVYWIDMPDLLESTELIQVQRGAGSGVIGYPAVGGSINIITSPFSDRVKFNLSTSLGSYNTRKYTISASSGLIDSKYSVYAKLGKILSSGYRNSSWTDFNSFHISAVKYDENVTSQFNFFGGPISDGLVYTGLPKFTIKDKELRRGNYSYWEAKINSYTYTLARRPDEIENFSQPHFELLNEVKLSNDLKLNSAVFLVIGNGFFDYDGSWSTYYNDYFRLSANGFDTTKTPTNALIRAMVENKQWGVIPRLSWNHNNGTLIVGAEYRNHRSVHWGSINHAENLPAGVTKDYRYYYYEGGKDILNFYAHESYNLNENISFLAEAQLAYHKYKFDKEKYVGTDFTVSDIFINPRAGINYKFNSNISAYLNFARVTREPRLKNYYDAAESSAGEVPQFELNNDGGYNFDEPLVKPETMNSFELGASYQTEEYGIAVNGFYMQFDDEIVKKGQVDRFGQPITGNVDRTIHAGVELTANAKFLDLFELILNGSYSKNYIGEGRTYLDSTNYIDLSDNRISGFPDLTFNGILKFRYEGFITQFFAKYVGDFYSDNYDNNLTNYLITNPGFVDYTDNKVDAYFVANAILSYEFEALPYLKKIKIFGQVNNIFDNLYAAYAIGKEFFPAAERNFLAGVTIGL